MNIDKKLLERIGKKLIANAETVAVAESVTAGILQWAFSCIPDAACFFQGGMTNYNLGQKYKHLGVDPIHAAASNCVSNEVAEVMAINICDRFSSYWGIAVTGYATAVPESENKIFAYYAICYKKKIKANGKLTTTKKDPQDVQQAYATAVLRKLAGLLHSK